LDLVAEKFNVRWVTLFLFCTQTVEISHSTRCVRAIQIVSLSFIMLFWAILGDEKKKKLKDFEEPRLLSSK
jgi:hypothetical protein